MAVNKTSLSAGEIIRSILTTDENVTALTSKVFPVVTDEATLPYILYRRSALSQAPHKGGMGADTVTIEVLCFAASYGDGIELAEAVRSALDGVQHNLDGLVMRSCVLQDSEEAWQDDAYVQQLIFTIKI